MARKTVTAATQGARVPYEDLLGKILVVEPLEIEKDINTEHGVTDAIRANVWALIGPNNTEEFEDTLIFPKVLFNQLRRKLDSIVVGRLTQGEKKKGKNAPWVLAAPTEGDMAKANAFLATQVTTSPSSAKSEDEDWDGDDAGDDGEEAF